RGVEALHERPGVARVEETARMPGVRPRMHSRNSARRDDGIVRGRVRRVLPRPPSGSCGVTPDFANLSCPVPASGSDRVLLGHGSGGRLSAELLRTVFLSAFGNEVLSALEDQATLPVVGSRLAFTTDSFVVRPLFFPGGDIGRLAVNGTVNDLVVGG